MPRPGRSTRIAATRPSPSALPLDIHLAPSHAEGVAGVIGGANPLIGLSPLQVAAAAGRWGRHLLTDPAVAVDHGFRLAGDLARILAGSSSVVADPKDRRFVDPTFAQNPVYRRVMQAYLAWRAELLATVDDLPMDEKSADRARFALSLVTEALAPTNSLLGNPAAIKRALETGGGSLLTGAMNRVKDVRNNGGMPTIVDSKPFRVGETVAVSPGAVVFRNDVLELIQYAPTTPTIGARPTLLIPPQINKFYVMDLAPGRSFIEHVVAQGVPFFAISWRNPTAKQRDWGLDTYLSAILEAVDVTLAISQSKDLNLLAMCAGGLTGACLLGHMAHVGDKRVRAASLVVTAIDIAVRSQINIFASERAVSAAISASRKKGMLEGTELTKVFAWMRPNDLVWNYWVSSYLLGEQPPAFDVLAWNVDSTNLPAKLHEEFMRMFLANPLVTPGAMTALGSPVDLGAVTCDLYAVGASTDHLVPWQGAYQATQLFGGTRRFVLSSSGHIQAIVNPPGNPKSRYFTNEDYGADPQRWLKGAKENAGTWWDDWAAWTMERSGPQRPAPTRLGNREYAALDRAPGRYVRE
ncbi:MAG TPA: alpha/beta fold hydrolase [Candidatus Dormibacteraeota bacterium]|nr:alpha/beta fold hydrolase [Candidatus Dormibacteraeota bacterium]